MSDRGYLPAKPQQMIALWSLALKLGHDVPQSLSRHEAARLMRTWKREEERRARRVA
jgi:hypothetical protein